MKVLLIIDPQNDFITGSLAVPGAIEAMDYLTRWVQEHHDEYDAFVVTLDQHPADHCSFDVQGGPWPVHCVRYTIGAALYPPLAEVLMATKRARGGVFFAPKATSRQRDAYSAFEDTVPDILMNARHIDDRSSGKLFYRNKKFVCIPFGFAPISLVRSARLCIKKYKGEKTAEKSHNKQFFIGILF